MDVTYSKSETCSLSVRLCCLIRSMWNTSNIPSLSLCNPLASLIICNVTVLKREWGWKVSNTHFASSPLRVTSHTLQLNKKASHPENFTCEAVVVQCSAKSPGLQYAWKSHSLPTVRARTSASWSGVMDFLKRAATRGCAAAHSGDKNRQYGATEMMKKVHAKNMHTPTITQTRTHEHRWEIFVCGRNVKGRTKPREK